MHHIDVPEMLGLFVIIFATARIMGAAAQWIGQPAVLGELIGGVLLGVSVLNIVPANSEVLHLFSEMGVIILLFEIGLETNLRKLLQVGGAASVVALVGVVLPFALGYYVCYLLGESNRVSIVAGASLTATSVGITARVFSDLGQLQKEESQIVLGAAVIDDVVGLVILAVVSSMVGGDEVTAMGVGLITAKAFGFLIVTLLLGRFVVPPLVRAFSHIDLPGTPTMIAIMLAFGLAWLADAVGSALIIGAFAAGLLLRETPHAHEIERGVAHLGHFFVPLFFVLVGTGVDLGVFNPTDPANRQTLYVGGLLTVAAIVGKFLAGYAPFWIKSKKSLIGVGMVPRGEVGLIFAQRGLTTGVFTASMFSAVTLMVIVTTFIAPPLLKYLSPPATRRKKGHEPEGIEELVTEP